jgi:RNase P subunit RPR2
MRNDSDFSIITLRGEKIGKLWRRWKDNIKMDLKEIKLEDLVYINLIQNMGYDIRFYITRNFVRIGMLKCRMILWSGHVARMGKQEKHTEFSCRNILENFCLEDRQRL